MGVLVAGPVRFGAFELRPSTFELLREGAPVALQPKVFDVLCHLVQHRDRVVTRAELLDVVWPDVHVDDHAVTWSVAHLRKALGQARNAQAPIETIRGRGYRFAADVQGQAPRVPDDAASSAPPADAAPPTRATLPSHGPFVGREDAMALLGAGLQGAAAGRGGLTLLQGPAGIGKSRCLRVLLERARAQGVPAWEARCSNRPGQPPLWAFVQLFRRAAAGLPHDDPRVEDVRALLRELTPEQTADAIDPLDATGRFMQLEHGQALLEALGREPALLVIDDLHWADAASLDLLAFVAPALAATGLCLVVGTRPPVSGSALATALDRVRRHAELWTLSGLDLAAVEALLRTRSDADPALAPLLLARSGGNPLLLQELLRLLSKRADGRPAAELLESEEASGEVLRVRLREAAPEVRALLERASVLGSEFDLRLLAEGGPPAATLAAAREEGFIDAIDHTRYRFHHDLLQQLTYETLPTPRRSAHHLAVAALLAPTAEAENRLGEVADHLHRALPDGDPDAAARAAQSAGDAAQSVHAHADAARYYGWALRARELAGEGDPNTRLRLLVARGSAQRLAGDTVGARTTLRDALALAQRRGDVEATVRIARILRPTYMMASVPDAGLLAALTAALPNCDARRSPAARADVLGQLSLLPPAALELGKCRALCDEARELARESGDPRALAGALRASLHALSGPDDTASLHATAEELAALAQKRGDPALEREALLARIQAHTLRAEAGEARARTEAFGALCQAHRAVEASFLHGRLLAQADLLAGRFEDAATGFQALLERGVRLRLDYARAFFGVHVALLVRARGGLKQAMAQARDERREGQSPNAVAVLLGLECEAGFVERTRADYERLVADDAAAVPRGVAWLQTLCLLSTVALAHGDTAQAVRLARQLRPYAAFDTPNPMLLCEGPVAHFLGLVAEAEGDLASAVEQLQAARALSEELGYRPFALRSGVALARVKARRGDADARGLSSTLVEQARALGMAPLARAAGALL